LANSDALKCRLACRLFEGIQALKLPLQKPQLCGGEIGSPTVSPRFWDVTQQVVSDLEFQAIGYSKTHLKINVSKLQSLSEKVTLGPRDAVPSGESWRF
jgi:hypothetical protein